MHGLLLVDKPSGLLLVDKPSGLTSHDVVARVRKIFHTKEVGHSGTLDPLASGLMVLMLGEATKLSNYITDGDKTYEVGVRMGVETDTLDITGVITRELPVELTKEEICQRALCLHGEIELPIPMYSAKKIDGKKLYEYARSGETIEVPKKNMRFWGIENLSATEHLKFSLSCSKGSFIRSWVKLLGERCDTVATMSELRRTKSHHFTLASARTLDQLAQMSDEEKMQCLVPLSQALPDVKKIRVRGKDETLMRNGQISHDLRSQLIIAFNPAIDELIQIIPSSGDGILALIGVEPGHGFKIRRILNA